jgi:hypothetical protein
MDIESLQKGIALFGTAVGTLRQAMALWPDTPDKDKAQAALRQAEREFKIAEAEAAAGLGYEVCRNHFPPEIMLSPDDEIWKCPECGNTKDTRPPKVSMRVWGSRR